MIDVDSALRYSEWLDFQGLLAPPAPEDRRTHEDLVNAFVLASKF